MNQDQKKLMQILKNLERDYEAGLISEEKYLYLSDQYMHKIKTIEVSDRIRAMQGKEETPSSLNSKDDISEKYREEKEQLVRKYIHNPETYNISSKPNESSTASPWYVALAVVFLLVAFAAGISFGMSSIGLDGEVSHMLTGGATINDTAFPEVKVNKSLSYNHTKSYSNITYGSSSDNSTSSSSSSSSGSSSSSSSSSSGSYTGGSSSGGSSSSGGTSSGGGVLLVVVPVVVVLLQEVVLLVVVPVVVVLLQEVLLLVVVLLAEVLVNKFFNGFAIDFLIFLFRQI